MVSAVQRAVSLQLRFRDSQQDDLVPWESSAVVLAKWEGVGRVPKATIAPAVVGASVDVTVPLGNSSPLNFSGAFSKGRGPRWFILEVKSDVASERIEFLAEKMPQVQKKRGNGGPVPPSLPPPSTIQPRLQAAALPTVHQLHAAAITAPPTIVPVLTSPLGLSPFVSTSPVTRAASKRPRFEPLNTDMARIEALATAASLSPQLGGPSHIGASSTAGSGAAAAFTSSSNSTGALGYGGSSGMPGDVTQEQVPRGKRGEFDIFPNIRTPDLGITPILREMDRSTAVSKRKATDDVDTALAPTMMTQWLKDVDRALEKCVEDADASLPQLMQLIMDRPDMLNQAQFGFDIASGQGRETLLYRCGTLFRTH